MINNQIVDVVILGSAHPLRGGLANYNHRLAQEYINQGFKVKIITFSLQYPSFLFPGKSQYSDEPAPDLDIEVKLNSINPLSWISVGRYIKKLKPKYLLIKFWIPFMGPALGTVARIVKANRHTKVISIIDNIIPHETRFGDKFLANYFVKHVDGFVTMSESVTNDLKTFTTAKPVLFNPHPLYDNFGEKTDMVTARKNLGLPIDASLVLFFGFIRDYKGLDLLLYAFGDERIKQKNISLIVAGEFYTDSKPYHSIIKEQEIGNKVHLFTGFIPDSRVGLFFSSANLVVQPYKDATQSGVTQIAYSFEKPMIVTNVGGLAEIVSDGNTGFVVDVNPKSIADKILKYFDENLEKQMEAHCAIEKKKYSWQKMLETIDKVKLKLDKV